MRQRKRVMAQMNVVPYIDVMLVLLVIFMVTATMMTKGVEINAPDADAEPLTVNNQQVPLVVSVDREGQFYLNDSDEAMSLEEITQLAQVELEQAADRSVYVRGDGQVEYQYLMQAMVALQQAGAKKLGLMAEPEK